MTEKAPGKVEFSSFSPYAGPLITAHNPLVVGSSPTGPTILKAAHCAAFVFLEWSLRSKGADQAKGPVVSLFAPPPQSNILNSPSGTFQSYAFRTQRDAQDRSRCRVRPEKK